MRFSSHALQAAFYDVCLRKRCWKLEGLEKNAPSATGPRL